MQQMQPPPSHVLEVHIIISPITLMLSHFANTGLPTKTAEKQTGICLIEYRGGFAVQRCCGDTPVGGQNSSIGYDVLKPFISYLIGYRLTDH